MCRREMCPPSAFDSCSSCIIAPPLPPLALPTPLVEALWPPLARWHTGGAQLLAALLAHWQNDGTRLPLTSVKLADTCWWCRAVDATAAPAADLDPVCDPGTETSLMYVTLLHDCEAEPIDFFVLKHFDKYFSRKSYLYQQTKKPTKMATVKIAGNITAAMKMVVKSAIILLFVYRPFFYLIISVIAALNSDNYPFELKTLSDCKIILRLSSLFLALDDVSFN